jgi:hypothetical protein
MNTGLRCVVCALWVQHEGYCSPLDGVEEFKLPLERCSQLYVLPSSSPSNLAVLYRSLVHLLEPQRHGTTEKAWALGSHRTAECQRVAKPSLG